MAHRKSDFIDTTACNRYNGVYDKDKLFNSFRMGDREFYCPRKTVDTTRPIVVTQSITYYGTSAGDLVEIRRLLCEQGSRVIANSQAKAAGLTAYNSVTEAIRRTHKSVFCDRGDLRPRQVPGI
eukprot:m51a1_g12559 putative glycosyl hydrolase family7 (124) ;mRNA; f:1483-1915